MMDFLRTIYNENRIIIRIFIGIIVFLLVWSAFYHYVTRNYEPVIPHNEAVAVAETDITDDELLNIEDADLIDGIDEDEEPIDPLVVDTRGLEEAVDAAEAEATQMPVLKTEDEVIAEERIIEERAIAQNPAAANPPAERTPRGGDVKIENGDRYVYDSTWGWLKSGGPNQNELIQNELTGNIIGF
jgi:hypothetical protein